MKNSIYTSWPLILSTIILLVNDHILKYNYPGLLTGKASDFAGIFLLVLVLRSIFNKNTLFVSIAAAMFFIWWKSPLSQSAIDFVNSVSPLTIHRTIDYTDLFALIMLPLAHHIFKNRTSYSITGKFGKFVKLPAICLSALSIMATSALVPRDEYSIRTSEQEQKIDIPTVVEIIKGTLNSHDLKCISCDPNNRNGVFKSRKITLEYNVLENDEGLQFSVVGEPVYLFTFTSSQGKMDKISSSLQYGLSDKYPNMEFVIDLDRAFNRISIRERRQEQRKKNELFQ